MSTSRTREKADGELFKSTGIDDNATSTAITINSDESVDFNANTANIVARFISTDGASLVAFKDSGTTGTDTMYLGASNSDLVNYTANGSITFTAGASESVRVTPDGLTFNGDTATANALDDYETGTFIPILRGSTSAGSFSTNGGNIGRYTKIGDVCTLNFTIAGTLSGATGSYTHFNLPFTVKAGTSATGRFSYVDTPNLSHLDFSSYVNAGQTLGYFIIKTVSATTPVYPAPSSFMPSSVQIYGTVTYQVA